MRSNISSASCAARPVCLLIWCLLLGACVRRTSLPTPTQDRLLGAQGYVDLNAGWRLRVVVPIVRSGGYVLPTLNTRQEGNAILVTTGDDFIGYETDYYALSPRSDSGVAIRFIEAEAMEHGKETRRKQPALQLFNLAPDLKFARLVYLIRESSADHDMVLLAAADRATLEEMTAEASSSKAPCTSPATGVCLRIPSGIAVVPEEKIKAGDRIEWRAVY